MNRLAPLLVAVVLTAAGVYGLVSSRKSAEMANALAAERLTWDAERERLEKDLAAARKRTVTIQAPAVSAEPATAQLGSPEEILEKLRTLRGNTRDGKSIRRVIFHLEQLHEIGPAAVPAIRAFLNRFEDVDYYSVRSQDDNDEDGDRDRSRGGFRFNPRDFRQNSRFDVRLSFTTPPSLRLGLVDVLQSIGGPEAEETLAEVLATTGRAVEVAYVAKVLQEMAPNQHGNTAVAAAKDLLLNPTQSAPGDRLDANSKDYLYHVLVMFNDTSFASEAQGILVTTDGQVDRQALAYLHLTLKEQAVPAIHQAYFDQRITNQMERAMLMNLALNYAGQNQQANEMLNSVISEESIPPHVRAMSLMALTRGEPDAQTLQARLPLVEALKGSTQDERVQRVLDLTHQNLQNMLEGKPVEEPWRALRGGGDRGPRGPRGGGDDGQTGGVSPEIRQRYGLPPG